MIEYNLDNVKEFITNNDFNSLNLVINSMLNKKQHSFNDLEIIKFILDTNNISLASKEKLKFLYLKYKKEIEEKIFTGEVKLSKTTLYDDYVVKPLHIQTNNNSAFVNFKTTILIILLTIVVVIAISFITLRG